jgi:hypothetical protein
VRACATFCSGETTGTFSTRTSRSLARPIKARGAAGWRPSQWQGDGQFEGNFAGYAPHFDFKVNADADERVFTMPSPSWTTIALSPDPPSVGQDLLIEWSPNNEEGISVSVTVDGDPVEEPNADPPGVSFADDGTFLLSRLDFASLNATGAIELSRTQISYSNDFGGDVNVAVSW